MAVYEQIGKGYDLTRSADPDIANRLAVQLQIKSDYSYLDVGCGTGNYTLALAKHGGIWHGVDQSKQMIDTAINKSHAVAWKVAEVEALPYADESFSGVLCTLAIHHFAALIPAFKEIYRVLLSGRFVFFSALARWINRSNRPDFASASICLSQASLRYSCSQFDRSRISPSDNCIIAASISGSEFIQLSSIQYYALYTTKNDGIIQNEN
jgi:ubiquinone/menaquinone biosynthesis C-methylase UbiE